MPFYTAPFRLSVLSTRPAGLLRLLGQGFDESAAPPVAAMNSESGGERAQGFESPFDPIKLAPIATPVLTPRWIQADGRDVGSSKIAEEKDWK